MKYYNFLSGKFANILNNNNTNVKISFKTSNNSIKTLNYKPEEITNKSYVNFNSYGVIVYLYEVTIHFTLEKLINILKFNKMNMFY